MKKLDKRGVTLIELLAVIAILGICTGAITGLYMTSIRMTKNADSEAAVMTSANRAVRKIADIMMAAADVPVQSGDSVRINCADRTYTFYVDKETEQLYLTSEAQGQEAVRSLISDHIQKIDIDTTETSENGLVKITIVLDSDGKESTIHTTVHMRNRQKDKAAL